MNKDERDDLERIAQEYHRSQEIPDKHIEEMAQRYTVPWLLRNVAKARHILELGYGDGVITSVLLESGADVTVIEGASTLVEYAQRQHGPGLRVVHTLFEDFVPSEGFDLVLALHVLEHVRDPVALLRRMKDWLAPGARVIAIVPNSESIHRRLAVLMGLQPRLDTLGPRDNLVGHRRVYSLDALVADFQTAGYVVEESTGFFLKVLPNSMMLNYSAELLAALLAISPELPERLLANIGLIATPSVSTNRSNG